MTIPSPGKSPKQPLPGLGLHDPLHGRQACTEFISFHQGVGQIYPREGLLSCRLFSKRGQICDIPAHPQSLNDAKYVFLSSIHVWCFWCLLSPVLYITYKGRQKMIMLELGRSEGENV